MSDKKTGGGVNAQHGAKGAGKVPPEAETDEYDLAADIKGDNSLHGDDQERVVNQRQAQAEATGKTMSTLDAIAGKRPEEDDTDDSDKKDQPRWGTTTIDESRLRRTSKDDD